MKHRRKFRRHPMASTVIKDWKFLCAVGALIIGFAIVVQL